MAEDSEDAGHIPLCKSALKQVQVRQMVKITRLHHF